ncbi:hypothetical protein MRX96_046051 [Rhipicephalus microplus]
MTTVPRRGTRVRSDRARLASSHQDICPPSLNQEILVFKLGFRVPEARLLAVRLRPHWNPPLIVIHTVEKSYRTAAFTVIVATATAVILSMYAYALFTRPAPEANVIDSLFCHTDDCEKQAHILQRWMNTSVDPCSNFDRYVCSKWMYAEGDVPFTGVMGYGLKWEDSLEDKLSHATQYIKYASHVHDVYRKCMGDVSTAESRKSLHQLKKFMRELQLPWPEAPPAAVEPLEVALDLSLS